MPRVGRRQPTNVANGLCYRHPGSLSGSIDEVSRSLGRRNYKHSSGSMKWEILLQNVLYCFVWYQVCPASMAKNQTQVEFVANVIMQSTRGKVLKISTLPII